MIFPDTLRHRCQEHDILWHFTFPNTSTRSDLRFVECRGIPRSRKFHEIAHFTQPVVFQHDCMPSAFPKVKKSYSWETSYVSKEEVVYHHQHFTQTESHEANITVESPSKWTSTTPVVQTSESIELNDTGRLGTLTAIGYTFSKIF